MATALESEELEDLLVRVDDDLPSPDDLAPSRKRSHSAPRRTHQVSSGAQFPGATHDRERARRLRQQAARERKLAWTAADTSAI